MTIQTIPRPASRAEWLALRKPWANASDASVYMGCNPYKTLADLAVEKLAPEPSDVTSRAMERGNRLEAAIADWWADEHHVAIYEPEVMFLNGRILSTLDRGIVGNDRSALEVKSTRNVVNGVTPSWWWQVQAQMFSADLDRVHVAVLDGTMDLASYTVERDDDAIAALVDAVERVWGFLDLGLCPEGCELSASHIAQLHPNPDPGSCVEVEGDGLAIVQEYLRAKDALAEAEEAEKRARDKVCTIFGENEALTVNGKTFLTWKQQTRTSFDSKSFLAEYPEYRAKFEKTSSFRVLRATRAVG